MPVLTQALAEAFDTPAVEGKDCIAEILAVARAHLGMDVAFITEFVGDSRVFRYVDPPENGAALRVGQVAALTDGFCARIVEGALPALIPDTKVVPLARAISETLPSPIGAHAGVPLRVGEGQVFGSFCCFSHVADRSLNPRDLAVMQALAALAAQQIERERAVERDRGEAVARIARAIRGEGFGTVFQPIYGLEDARIVGVECLARFATQPLQPPDRWFADAERVGLRAELEDAALREAVASLSRLPDAVYLAVNVSPSTILLDGFASRLSGLPLDRLVLEITEHTTIADYAALATRLAPLRRRGLRIAVDDAGAGYASLRHVLNLEPDVIKLDMSLTRNVDTDPARRALGAALVGFARDVGATLVAEGVETEAELATLRGFGVTIAQGFGLCRPLPLPEVLALIEEGEPSQREALRAAGG